MFALSSGANSPSPPVPNDSNFGSIAMFVGNFSYFLSPRIFRPRAISPLAALFFSYYSFSLRIACPHHLCVFLLGFSKIFTPDQPSSTLQRGVPGRGIHQYPKTGTSCPSFPHEQPRREPLRAYFDFSNKQLDMALRDRGPPSRRSQASLRYGCFAKSQPQVPSRSFRWFLLPLPFGV